MVICCKTKPQENIKLSGPVFGTAFNIQYLSDDNTNYINEIDSLFSVVNQSLSTYVSDSDISKINRGELDNVDLHFINFFKTLLKNYKLHFKV